MRDVAITSARRRPSAVVLSKSTSNDGYRHSSHLWINNWHCKWSTPIPSCPPPATWENPCRRGPRSTILSAGALQSGTMQEKDSPACRRSLNADAAPSGMYSTSPLEPIAKTMRRSGDPENARYSSAEWLTSAKRSASSDAAASQNRESVTDRRICPWRVRRPPSDLRRDKGPWVVCRRP